MEAPNSIIERTSSSRLRLPTAAAHVEWLERRKNPRVVPSRHG